MKILVTGGSGFIGSALIEKLLSYKYEVRILDDFSRGKNIKFKNGTPEVVEGSIFDSRIVEIACEEIDAVIHLAAINGTKNFYERPLEVFSVSVEGTLNVINSCKMHQIDTLIYASSAEVYGDPDQFPTKESYRPRVNLEYAPRYSYGGGKLVGEMLMNFMSRHLLKRPMIFRPHNVYGPNMGIDHVIPELILKISKLSNTGEGNQLSKLQIQGSGNETRSFIYIDDAVEGIIKVLKEGKPFETYHIGSQEEVSIATLVSKLCLLMDKDVQITMGGIREGSPVRRLPDISKMKALGFESKYSLSEGLIPTVHWYTSTGNFYL